MTHKSRKEEILFGLYYISNIHHCVVIISMTPKSKKKKTKFKTITKSNFTEKSHTG